MNKLKTFLFFSFLLTSVLSPPSSVLHCAEPPVALTVTKVLDMEEAVRLARLNNPALLAALEDIAIAQQRVWMARHLSYPQIGFDASAVNFSAARDFVVNEGLGGAILKPTATDEKLYLGRGTLEQVLYTGGRNRKAVHLSKATLEQADIAKDKIDRQIMLDVKLRFVDYLRILDKELIIKNLTQALGRMGPGGSALAELLLEDARLNLEMDLEEIREEGMPQKRAELLRAIGMDLFSEIMISGDIRSQRLKKAPSLTTALSWARELRPEYRSQALASEMDATQVAIALAGRNPVVSLAGTYEVLGKDFPLRTENWAALVRMHLPFSWDNWTTIRERNAQRRKGQVLRVDIEDQIASEVRQAHASLTHRLVRLEKEKTRLQVWNHRYGQALALAKDSRERIELFKGYSRMQLAWLDAQAAALQAIYQMEHAVGRPLE